MQWQESGFRKRSELLKLQRKLCPLQVLKIFFGIVPLTVCTLDSFWCCVLLNSEDETVNVDGKNFFFFFFTYIWLSFQQSRTAPQILYLRASQFSVRHLEWQLLLTLLYTVAVKMQICRIQLSCSVGNLLCDVPISLLLNSRHECQLYPSSRALVKCHFILLQKRQQFSQIAEHSDQLGYKLSALATLMFEALTNNVRTSNMSVVCS